MRQGHRTIGKLGLAGLLPALTLAVSGAPATAVGAEADEVEEIKVTGSRRAHRTGGDTLAPLDIISGSDFSRQGRGETTDMLRTLIPAYNVNAQPISDAATLIRPANLRGLSPDQTLVLVNGKRRHRAAVISFLGGGVSSGAQGPDVSAIPAIALKQVEVLRDGASAQYGSDAIAGVINFVLRDEAEGGVVETKFGQTYSGDGEHRQLSANLGLPLGDAGFINLSGDWKERDPTVRSVQRGDAQALIAAGNTDVEQPYAQIWGQPDLSDDWKGFVNMAAAFSDEAEFYAFGNYSERETLGGFFFRNPNDRGGVFSRTGTVGGVEVPARLVGDRTPDDAADCPDDVVIAARLNAEQRAALRGAGIDPEAHEAQRRREIAANANCFLFNERFPGGFRPKFGGELTDEALTAGVRGEFDSGLTYDLSASYGENEVDFFIYDTINASLGLTTPTSFRLGSYTQTEEDLNLDVSYPLEIDVFASPLNVAAGLEWRNEEFEVSLGEPDSWRAGPYAQQGFGVGANGFSGFGPSNAGKWDRTSRSRYLDLEADVRDDLTLGAALRWEDYDDFGTTTTWKLSGLYRVYDQLRMRAAWHTGFRAPTVGQQNVTNLTTAFQGTALVQRGTIRPTTPLAQALGGSPLRPEKSDSFTIGAIMDIAAAEVTLDYFYIAVDDRIFQTQSFVLSQQVGPGKPFANQAALDAARRASGFAANLDLSNVRFFTNDFNTRTRGMDLVATVPLELPLELLDGGESELTVAANWTKTKIVRHDPNTVDAKRIGQIEKSLPRFKGNATLTHDAEDWRALVRANYYGHALEYHVDSAALLVKYGAEITWDLEFGYRPVPELELTLGADNVFDNRPDENPYAGVVGSRYPESAAMGSQGGFYYMKASYEF